jgi:hypothetical protein
MLGVGNRRIVFVFSLHRVPFLQYQIDRLLLKNEFAKSVCCEIYEKSAMLSYKRILPRGR